MKNHRAILISRIIFITSVFYSYNTNASLNSAVNSLISLIDEIKLKQHQLNQSGTPISYDLELNNNIALMRIYHASLLARQKSGSASSKDIFIEETKKQFSRPLPDVYAQFITQVLTGLMSSGEGGSYFTFHGHEEKYGIPQSELFCEIDRLNDEEIYEKTKEHLSKIYDSLKNDQVFLTTCTNFDLKSEYKTTIELMSTALH
ncbi:hypothetical protein [Endozoicomonas sp. 8E]|uniref:hypothetical protein n=1 Tax=Endozoicomonas sp. 8E TaxID=3035692 RepID=UPI002938D5C1|nr:hypothetical protein [Endozoicomonas sp. 8E]WOG29156.1 hypothetical protein P6910_05680 [Endozoicomonas sp. 8E]